VLSKKHRLPIKEFPKGGATALRGKLLSFKRAGNSLDRARVGVLVGKRINPKASVRNALRRFVYRFYREHLNSLPTEEDLLVIVETPIIEFDSSVEGILRGDLTKSLKTTDNKH